MSATTIDAIRDRVTSICHAAPFGFQPSADPFSFDLQPATNLDQTFFVQTDGGPVTAGTNFSETRVDSLRIWVARRQTAAASDTYRKLQQDVSSLTAAITRDGLVGGGDYAVVDSGRGFSISHNDGQEYAVLRLTLPCNYEAQL